MIQDFIDEYQRYRIIGERALAQMSDADLNHISAAEGSSAAMIVRHMSGNLISRFTDFLTSDGEKGWRNRDGELDERSYSRGEVEKMWMAGWEVLQATVGTLTDADLAREVTIRGQVLSVHAALCRSMAHVGYHSGQLVLLARQSALGRWQWISIPKGESKTYTAAPELKKGPL